MGTIEYDVSLERVDCLAMRHGYSKKNGYIILFLERIWKEAEKDEHLFRIYVEFLTILERICLECVFQHIPIDKQCDPCKLESFALEMLMSSFD